MSENLYIGISKEQTEALLKGKQIGKRPYNIHESYNAGEVRYNDTIRIYIRMLSKEEHAREPKTAFEW